MHKKTDKVTSKTHEKIAHKHEAITHLDHGKKGKGKMKLIWKILIIIVGIYILVGIGFGVAVYKYHSESKATKIAVKIYPYPVAWVGWTPVWANDYYQYLGYIKTFAQKSNQTLPDEKEVREQVLNQLIDVTLIKKLAKQYNVKVTKQDIDDAYNKIKEQSGDKDLKEVLREMYGMTEAQFKSLITDQLLREKLLTALNDQNVLTQVKVKHILIKDEGQAKDVLAKIKAGEDFATLAKERSEDAGSKDNGGDLGWVSRGMMVKEFEDAAFKLNSGETSQDLVKTEFGYHIIKVDEKKGTTDKSFADWFNDLKTNKYKVKKWIS